MLHAGWQQQSLNCTVRALKNIFHLKWYLNPESVIKLYSIN